MCRRAEARESPQALPAKLRKGDVCKGQVSEGEEEKEEGDTAMEAALFSEVVEQA